MSYPYGSGVGGGKPSWAPATTPVSSAAQERLLHTEQSYARMQQDLQNLVQTRATTPMSAVDTGRAGSEIARMQQLLLEMGAEITGLKATIARQEATIKTQSDAIANPKRHYVTPVRFGDNTPHGRMLGQGSGQHMPPPSLPAFNTSTNTPGNPTQQQPYMASAHGPQHQPANMQSPSGPTHSQPWNQQLAYQGQGPQTPQFPMGYHTTPTGPSYGSHATPYQAPGSDQGMFGSQPRAQQPSNPNPNTMAVVPAPAMQEDNPVKVQFAKVWSMAEAFARSHVNLPSTSRDNAMPQRVKDILLNAATRTTAFQFMSTPVFRYFLVTKMIVQWLLKTILKVDSFAGLDDNVDRVIASCRSQIYQSTPAQVKFQLLTTVVQQMAVLKQNPNFEAYLQHLARTRGNELWADLQTMMHQKTSRDWDDLLSLMIEAHRLAALMYSGPNEYRYEMPQYGQPFSKEAMEPKDTHPNVQGPEKLEEMGATVRLAFTPHVILRTSLPNGHVTSRTLLRAYVLLKVGN
ncbi:hypothetical protein A1O1_00243 [Capronia coronata CBS 617.96]|uniref:Uncharacterized protein n=1 Tax=Capronia coronata CBS 617.96 TaxID=1182541 RepID=W9ZKT7_9EURO|nr:uncharacterized protein A1O1_00243 [Capronia coronata CBS 617.96]EXJ95124.1 hypothetical protein A1O1_00243 [Capronia coronata CBS 617.96]